MCRGLREVCCRERFCRFALLVRLVFFPFLFSDSVSFRGGKSMRGGGSREMGVSCGGGFCAKGIGVPGVGDDDVVERCVALAKTRETDLEDHVVCCNVLCCRQIRCFVDDTAFFLRRLVGTPLQRRLRETCQDQPTTRVRMKEKNSISFQPPSASLALFTFALTLLSNIPFTFAYTFTCNLHVIFCSCLHTRDYRDYSTSLSCEAPRKWV